MKKELLKYIDEEKSISKYKITLLRKGPEKPYKTRLLSIESDFISYPFHKIKAENINELKDALNLFRLDRAEFNKAYSSESLDKTRVISASQLDNLRDKIAFYEKLHKTLLEKTLQEVNIIQNEYIKSKVSKELRSEGVDSLLEAEGAAISKERARIQILIYALGRYIYHEVQSAKDILDSNKEISATIYDSARYKLNSILENIKFNIFKYYNDGIKEVPLLINGTLGHNNFVHSVYPLVNLINKHSNSYKIERVLPIDMSFFKESGRPIRKRFVERGFSIITPINRVGNEAISLLHIELWSESGTLLTPIVEKSFYNYNKNKEYYKAISTKPIWSMNNHIDNPFLLREVLALLSLDKEPLVGSIDFSDKALTERINKTSNGEIIICSKFSKILVAATRSESDHIKQACSWVDLLIKQIKNDYKTLFNPLASRGMSAADRVVRVTGFGE